MPKSSIRKFLNKPAVRLNVIITLVTFGISITIALFSFNIIKNSTVSARVANATSEAVEALISFNSAAENGGNIESSLQALNFPNDKEVVVYFGNRVIKLNNASLNYPISPQIIESIPKKQNVSQFYSSPNGTFLEVLINSPSASVLLIEPADDLVDSIDALFGFLLAGVLLNVLLVIMLSNWARRKTLSPVKKLTRELSLLGEDVVKGNELKTDIDELRSLTSSLNAMIRDIKAKLEENERFVSNVTHELRSPLATLLNALEVIKLKKDGLNPSQIEAIELLDAEINRFSQMVLDLLEISTSHTKATLNKEDVVIDSYFTEVCRDLNIAKEKLIIDPSAKKLSITLDKRRIERAISNLVENANLYGGGLTAIRVKAFPQHIEICVEDSGEGIDPQEQERIFERFYRGRASQKFPDISGSGLGLTLANTQVKLHGGIIKISSVKNLGTKMTIVIPKNA